LGSEYLEEQARRRFAIVAVVEVCVVTGLDPDRRLQFDGAGQLAWVTADGRRERTRRLPAELVPRLSSGRPPRRQRCDAARAEYPRARSGRHLDGDRVRDCRRLAVHHDHRDPFRGAGVQARRVRAVAVPGATFGPWPSCSTRVRGAGEARSERSTNRGERLSPEARRLRRIRCLVWSGFSRRAAQRVPSSAA
jgi:hypothetical protein